MIHKTPSKSTRPPQASTSSTPTTLSTPSKTTSKATHRLLYRGALSLPDSHLLLDGLSFVASTHGSSAHGIGDGASVGMGMNSPAAHLLENPLALALESMRGRPSLHLLGTEKVRDVCLDARGAVGVCVV